MSIRKKQKHSNNYVFHIYKDVIGNMYLVRKPTASTGGRCQHPSDNIAVGP